MSENLRQLTAKMARERSERFDQKDTQFEAVMGLIDWMSRMGETYAVLPPSFTFFMNTQKSLKDLGYDIHVGEDSEVIICWADHTPHDARILPGHENSVKH